MSEQTRSYYKNFALLLTGNSVSQLIPFLLAPIIGRLFSPEQLAVQENFLAIVAMLAIVAAGRYEIAFVLPKISHKANNLFALALSVLACVSFLSLFLLFFPEQISGWYRDEQLGKFILYIPPAVLLFGLYNILLQWMIRFGKYSWVSSSRMIQSLIQYGGYALLGYWGWGVSGLILAVLIGNLLPVIILLFPSLEKFSLTDVSTVEMKNVAKEHKDLPIINSLHAFTDIFATQFLLFWLITRNYGAAALGLFAIMNRYLRAPLNLIGNALGQLYYREASTIKNEGGSTLAIFNKSTLIISSVTIPAMIVVFWLGPDLFALYLGDKWREAGELARLMAPAIFFNMIVSPTTSTPLIFGKLKAAYIISTLGHVVSLGMLFLTIYLGFDFNQSLIVYSTAVSIFYIVLFIWYRGMIKQKK